MFQRIAILFVILSGLVIPVSATDLTVNVTDKNKPLPDATVAILELKLHDITGDDGSVVLKNVKPGKYTLVSVLDGYERWSESIEVTDVSQTANIQMKIKVYQMKEITVTGKRNKGKVPAQTTVRQEDFKSTSQSYMNDAVKTLQTMPGVSGSGGTFDSRMYIQGGADSEYISVMDDVFVMNSSRWGGRISMFNPNIVESIDLYTAGYPSFMGEGLSGVIWAKTVNGDNQKLGGFVDLSAAAMEVLLQGPVNKDVTFLFNVRRTFYDFIAPLFLSPEQRVGVQFPYLWDGIMKLNWNMSPQDSLSFMLYGSLEGMTWNMSGDPNGGEGAGDSTGKFYYEDINLIGSIKYDHRFDEGNAFDVVFAATPHFGNYQFDNSSINQMNVKVQEYNYEFNANYYWNSIKGHKIQFGTMNDYAIPYANIKIKNYYLNNDNVWTNQSIDQNYDSINFLYNSAYAMDNWEFIPSWILMLGGRYEYFNLTREQSLTPQGGLKYEINDDLDVYFRTGLYNRYPMNISYIDSNSGNPNLLAEKAAHYLTGIDYANNYWTFRLEGFYKNYYNMWESDCGKNFNNNGLRDVYGGAIYIQKKAVKGDWLSGWISYSYATGMEKVTDRSDTNIGQSYSEPFNEWFVPGYLRNHTISSIVELTYYKNDAVSFLNFLDKWKLSFDLRILSGKPYTPVTNFSVQDIPTVGKVYNLKYGEFNSEWTPWTSKLDIKITFPASLFSLLNLLGMNVETSSYISFVNVLNTRNVVDYYYTVKDNELKKNDVLDFPFMILGGMRMDF